MTQETIFKRDDLEFIRCSENNYCITFNIKNNDMILPKIINFDLLKLVYELNPDIYEQTIMNVIDENNAKTVILMKHFFKDLGMAQAYFDLNITKVVDNDDYTMFISSQNYNNEDILPEFIPDEARHFPIININFSFEKLSNHEIKFTCNIELQKQIEKIPQMIENFIGQILYKIFKRVKLFIENVKI